MLLSLLHLWIGCTSHSSSEPQKEVTLVVEEMEISAYLSPHLPNVINVDVNMANASGNVWVTAQTQDGERNTKTHNISGFGTIPILGIPPNSQVELQIFSNIDEEYIESTPFLMETENLIPQAGQMSLSITQYSEIPDGYFMGSLFGEPEILVIFDTQGEFLWATRQYDDENGGIDSTLSVDNQSILFNRFAKDNTIDNGAIIRIGFDGSPIETITTPMGHHLFTELPDGTITYIALDIRETEAYGSVCGDQIIEVTPDGEEHVVFSTWDTVTLYESSSFYSPFYTQCHDWTHGNGIVYNETQDTYLFSMAGTNLIYEIDRMGNVLHRFGGLNDYDADYTFEPPDSVFAYPHGANWSNEGELMLLSTKDLHSRFISFEVDRQNQKLRKRWHYGAGYNYNVQYLGEIKEIDQANRMINWGSLGHLQIISPTGNIKWEAHASLGHWFAQFEFIDTLPGMEE